MSALRVSPAVLRAAVASNAARSPIPPHHRRIYETLAHGAHSLTSGDIWVLESLLKLPGLTERQLARLNELSVKVERGRA